MGFAGCDGKAQTRKTEAEQREFKSSQVERGKREERERERERRRRRREREREREKEKERER